MNKNIAVKINSTELRDKVYACWLGKNIGGTMGGPYEGKREVLDVKGFVTKPGEPLPNDDLDLQLVWLHAVERIGPRSITATTLGEFWLSFITPHWNEYGLAKNNMKRGLIPPLAGDYENDWKHSNGAWIRTEVWACMAPACPDIAVRYAVEDAKVDHGVGEGTYAAAFVAGMQSAAFVIGDLRRCIEIGLSEIPEESRVADSVRLVIECYDQKLSPIEARNKILERNRDIGNGWFEAPSNVAYTVLGLLYGEGDFKKSMITAINCGDDTDCTAATVGATLGILGGTTAIPADWREYIGDDIITVSIACGGMGRYIPKTCTELTDRVVMQTPHVLFANNAYTAITDEPTLLPEDVFEFVGMRCWEGKRLSAVKPYSTHFDFNFLKADVTLEEAPDIAPMGVCRVSIRLKNKTVIFDGTPYNLTMRWWLPEGFSIESGRKTAILPHINAHQRGVCELAYVIRAGERVEATNRCVLEIVAEGRITPIYIPITLLG